jgi:hypothetical protein
MGLGRSPDPRSGAAARRGDACSSRRVPYTLLDAMTVTASRVSAALACVVAACLHQARPPQPPSDARERRRAEVAACTNGKFPVWLDDTAVSASVDVERREAQASAANDSFRGATFSSQPPPTTVSSARVAALVDERRAFQQWCAGLRSTGPTSPLP